MDNQPEQQSEKITVLGYDDGPTERGFFDKRLPRRAIPVEQLQEEVKSFLNAMDKVVGSIGTHVGSFEMDTITVSAEVNAKGKVSLLGSGGEMGGKGGLSFTFKRPKADEKHP